MKIIFKVLLGFLLAISGLITWAASPYRSFESSIEILSDPSQVQSLGQVKLRVMTYNMGYASGSTNNKGINLTHEEVIQNLDQMIQEIKEINPDVLALQEVDFDAHRTVSIDQLKYLAQALGYPFSARVVTWNKKYLPWPYWPLSRNYRHVVGGQAVLSRYPLSEQRVFQFQKPAHNAFWYNWFYPEKVIQKVKIKVSEKNLSVWNVHLEAFEDDSNLTQLKSLGGQMRATLPDVVLGDFNAPTGYRLKESDEPDAKEASLILRHDAFQEMLHMTQFLNAEKSGSMGFTIPSWNPNKKIDHILLKSGFKFENAGIGKNQGSDHLPVWADMTL